MDTEKRAIVRTECPVRKPKIRRTFTAEFKAKTVRQCQTGSRSIGQVAKDLDLSENSVRRWVAQAEVDAGNGDPGALTSEEKTELTALRREVRELKEDREILKAAAIFFAKEKQ